MVAADAGRLIVVSNRLPVTLKKVQGKRVHRSTEDFRMSQNPRHSSSPGRETPEVPEDKWTFTMSSGGLVSALEGVKAQGMRFEWVGWPGTEIPEAERAEVSALLAENSCVPVHIDAETADLHYNGYANSVLWPLFHYRSPDIRDIERTFDGYYRANSAFADVLCSIAREGDNIWVHDYHLMLLPEMLRERLVEKGINVTIGWFLHTPFPSSEMYRALPQRVEILRGVLSSDLLGFHTYDYARHFLSSVKRALGQSESHEYRGRRVNVQVFPIGIDPQKWIKGLEEEAIKAKIAELKKVFAGRRVIVGVDRLDYIKGVPHKLLGLETYLKENPQAKGKVVLVQVAVPSRPDVEEYQALMAEVNQLVGKINGDHGVIESCPIHYIHRSVTFTELVALYTIADACLVSSLRDGMNLVSYEYVMTQRENHGSLILSEFAGAAQSLGHGAILINPWDTKDIANAIHTALVATPEMRAKNYDRMHKIVSSNTAAKWGKDFVHVLTNVAKTKDPSPRPKAVTSQVVGAYQAAKKRIFLLDYDGTLSPHKQMPSFAAPPQPVLDALQALSDNPANLVYILSGRTRASLEECFPDLPNLGLCAEYGYFIRHPSSVRDGRAEWDNVTTPETSWFDTARPILAHYTARTPGAWTEYKESSITWHYRAASRDFGESQARQMAINIIESLRREPVETLEGTFTLDLRPTGVNKGACVQSILSAVPDLTFDFVLAIGDDVPDEDMFSAVASSPRFADVGSSSFLVRVGEKSVTAATSFVRSASEASELIDLLAKA